MRKSLLIIIVLAVGTRVFSQQYFPFKEIKRYTDSQKASRYDSLRPALTNRLGVELHYLYPLYQAIGWSDKFRNILGEKRYNENFARFLAFAGDYPMASEYLTRSFEHLADTTVRAIGDEVYNLQDIQSTPAAAMIAGSAAYNQIIMINEAYAKPVHRAFTYSLLADLYSAGYRYLAMETLNGHTNASLDSLNALTGTYTSEPVGGELARKALQLGYTLVAYEDTAAETMDPSIRDSIHAQNICKVIRKDPKAKILVHAGYSQICKEDLDGYKPMGYWIKRLSGINPFCIDQTSLTEGGDFEYERLYYDFFTTRFAITTASVVFRARRPFNPFGQRGYDMTIVHPPTVLANNRPTWLSLGGERREVLIQPSDRNLFFVQAYYADEYSEESRDMLVPADQTYTTNSNGYYCLYLRRGHYKIVMRDAAYKVLAVKDREVN